MQSQWARLPGLRVPRHGPASSRQGRACCGSAVGSHTDREFAKYRPDYKPWDRWMPSY